MECEQLRTKIAQMKLNMKKFNVIDELQHRTEEIKRYLEDLAGKYMEKRNEFQKKS